MPGIRDFLFGSGTLKKAAGESADKSARAGSAGEQPAGIDIAKLAQESADREARAKTAGYKPASTSGLKLSTTMTPHKKVGK